MFFCEINLFLYEHYNVFLKLVNIDDNFKSCKLTFTKIKYSSEMRQHITQCVKKDMFQLLISKEIRYTTPKNNINFEIPFDYILRGLFIECDNVNDINCIQLCWIDRDPTLPVRNLYNKFIINKKCNIINNNLLYLPFNYDTQYNNKKIITNGLINNNRFRSAKLSFNSQPVFYNLLLSFDNECDRICIYGYALNIYMTSNGLIKILDENNYEGHKYENINDNIINT